MAKIPPAFLCFCCIFCSCEVAFMTLGFVLVLSSSADANEAWEVTQCEVLGPGSEVSMGVDCREVGVVNNMVDGERRGGQALDEATVCTQWSSQEAVLVSLQVRYQPPTGDSRLTEADKCGKRTPVSRERDREYRAILDGANADTGVVTCWHHPTREAPLRAGSCNNEYATIDDRCGRISETNDEAPYYSKDEYVVRFEELCDDPNATSHAVLPAVFGVLACVSWLVLFAGIVFAYRSVSGSSS